MAMGRLKFRPWPRSMLPRKTGPCPPSIDDMVPWHLVMSRWTELKVLKPRGLELQQPKAINMKSVTRYCTDLESILDKYCLKDKPQKF
ncbi:hypothetical protein DPMN_139286 [Dreissena polymorpha]|uniref:Uncharacterized protein n=1 Tax=Dreissena polymorpha TaxID=45954 RepID=A0A9D4JJB7_DREPO|nr:hypothetical protein DPMN_139286 [Dreissena polymorpha]